LDIYSLGFPVILCGLLAGTAYLVLRPSVVRDSIQAAASTFGLRPKPAQERSRDQIAKPSSDPQTSRGLPLAGWIAVLWPTFTTVFYIANHTYVQTRYILVTAPGLTIVILALALSACERAGQVLYVTALLSAVAISVVAVRPYIRNKAINCQAGKNFALFVRDRIPPDAPVATYSIGEIAFVSQHAIIDTSGITRPDAILYLNDRPEVMLHWARSQGAQYLIGNQPEPGAVLVYTANEMFVGWTFRTALYSASSPVELWKLTPSPGLLEQRNGRLTAERPGIPQIDPISHQGTSSHAR
jgi:hypothetical protein